MISSMFIKLFFCFILVLVICSNPCLADKKAKKQVDDSEDVPETNESLDVASEPVSDLKPCQTRKSSNSTLKEVTNAQPREFPFMAALLTHEKEFICSGVVIQNGLVLTAAHCLMPSLTYVMLNATSVWNNNKKNNGVYVNVVGKEEFPTYSKVNAGKNEKDVGIVITETFNKSVASMISLMNYTSTEKIADFMALGYGLNAQMGSPKPLQQVIINHRSIHNEGDTFKGFIDCIDTKVLTCFKDTGGPAIWNDQVIGIIVSGQEECTKEITSEYAINKAMVDVLPTFLFQNWVDERKTHYKKDEEVIVIHPVKPVSIVKSNYTKPITHKMVRRTRSDSSRVYDANTALLMTTIPCIFVITLSLSLY